MIGYAYSITLYCDKYIGKSRIGPLELYLVAWPANYKTFIFVVSPGSLFATLGVLFYKNNFWCFENLYIVNIMGSLFMVILGTLLIAWGNSEKVKENADSSQASVCNPEECSLLRNRLESLEDAVLSIVSAIASQKKGAFAPINKILERDPAFRAVLSSTSNFNPTNATDKFGNAVWHLYNLCVYSKLLLLLCNTKADEIHGQEKDASRQLKGAVKCSLANLLDINTSGNFFVYCFVNNNI